MNIFDEFYAQTLNSKDFSSYCDSTEEQEEEQIQDKENEYDYYQNLALDTGYDYC